MAQAMPAAIAHWPTCQALERSRARRCRSEVRPRVIATSRCGAAGAPARVRCWRGLLLERGSTAVEHRQDLCELGVGLRGALEGGQRERRLEPLARDGL